VYTGSVNPELFARAKLGITPSLKTLEPYKLKALIIEDLRYNGKSKLSEIQDRMREIPKTDIQKAVYRMAEEEDLRIEGGKRNRTYELFKEKMSILVLSEIKKATKPENIFANY
jgi:ATP-dependent DNA helicase RecG